MRGSGEINKQLEKEPKQAEAKTQALISVYDKCDLLPLQRCCKGTFT